jgi:hypothetical protein
MKVTMQVPASVPISSFFEHLKKVATDKVHENNVDLIADFVEKVLVVEMKRLENDPETFEQVIEIPDAVVIEPLRKAKKQFDDFFTKFLTERGAPDDPATDNTGIPYPKKSEPKVETKVEPVPTPTQFVAKRSGNGHKIAKIRSLYGSEKDTIKAEFLNMNGQIAEDACKFIHARLGNEVSIFQVTGFVTYLHSMIAGGSLEVRDMASYLTFLQGHRNLWAKWNSPKYQAMRANAAFVNGKAKV